MDANNFPNNQSPRPYFNLSNFPYDSFNRNVTLQIPSFSTQPTHAPTQTGIPYFTSQPTHATTHPEILSFGSETAHAQTQPEDSPTDRRERRKWSNPDDLVLISGWLNTSKDVIVGNDQRSGTFWKRITEFYASSYHVSKGAEPRDTESIRNRWGKISRDVSKFCGSYAFALGAKASGQNDTDILQLAHQTYTKNNKNRKFTLEHAWNKLRYEPKWCTWINMNPTSRTASKTTSKTTNTKRKASEAEPSVGSTMFEEESRPMGIKAMKKLRKKGKEKAAPSPDFDKILDAKQKDMALKKELQQMSLLDTLIAKKETLDEEQLALMKKLVAEVYRSM